MTGPVTGGNGVPVLYSNTTFDLKAVGYRQSEYFLQGTANAYSPTAPLTADGKWTVTPSSQAPYQTRVVVNRPIDERAFNGTVVVEWLNVTGGADASPDWMHLHTELVRRGYAWVGVSAQADGLNALKTAPLGDPVRYAALAHPGDSYSYDMFSQAGRAVRDDAGQLLDGLVPQRVIAAGESQSAARLSTYLDAVHPLANVYDGFLVHSLIIPGGAPLSQSPLPDVPTPLTTRIRDDLDTPVLVVQTETDAGGLLARRPDSAVYRLWEVAGTAHFDLYGLRQGASDTGNLQTVADWFDSLRHPTNQPLPDFTCDLPINSGPQTFVLRAAMASLNRWVATGTPPAEAPRLKTNSVQPLEYAVDANGNVLGGIRTPAVDAPVAKLGGLGNGGSQACQFFGSTEPFSAEKLTALYRDHRGFVAAWNRATLSAVAAGYLLPEDAKDLLAVAAQSRFVESR
ncbi:alpha/beta hydrolase domain-containing protein [Streptomyces sp. NPDC048251]|uniref:alpha/beta hydrolase domain-containing protein n=1 Tax=Streptomyces sp. NPDC048251 TaxID=3154501 RepID=UPI00343B9686